MMGGYGRRRGRRVLVARALATLLTLAACTEGSAVGGRSSAANFTTPPGPASCPSASSYPAPDPRRPVYNLAIDIQPARSEVTGTMTVRFTPDLDTDRLVFRLWPNSPPQAAEGAHLSVGAVRSGRRLLRTEQTDATTLLVTPPGGTLGAGQNLTLSMPWRLTVPSDVADRISRSEGSMRLGSFFPILAWEPGVGWAIDPPTTSLAEASTSPTADFHVAVHAPADMTVVATGARVGDHTWRAIGVRDFALAAGDLALTSATVQAPDPVHVTVAIGAGSTVSGTRVAGMIGQTLGELSSRYGPYPWPDLTMVVTDDLDGHGIEYPNLLFEGSDGVERVTTHELAHQWFYSLAGNDQARDPWVDEALASWGGSQTGGYFDYLLGQRFTGLVADHVGSPMTFWDQHTRDYENGVYVRGVQALASLGPADKVDCALRLFVATNAYGIATTSDLVSALSMVFPAADQRLAPFGI
jgi:hypothetical protein